MRELQIAELLSLLLEIAEEKEEDELIFYEMDCE